MELNNSGIKSISAQDVDDHVELIIRSEMGDEILVSSDECEITLCYGQSHWHINSYSDPLDIDSMKITCLNNVMDVINSRIITYSAWNQSSCLGGSSINYEIDIYKKAQEVFPKADMIKVQSFNSEIKTIKFAAQQGDAPESASPPR